MPPAFRYLVATFSLISFLLPSSSAFDAAESSNQLGIELLRKISAEESGNLLLSPYSLSSVLAPLYVGSEGATRTELARVLRFPEKNILVEKSFAKLRQKLSEAGIVIESADRLFVQRDFTIRAAFSKQLRDAFDIAPQPLDFVKDPLKSASTINDWVSRQTHGKITSAVPQSMPTETKLVLVNALYFHANWKDSFERKYSIPRPFHTDSNKATIQAPSMSRTADMGYAHEGGFQVVSIPYVDSDYHCLIILTDQTTNSKDAATRLTAGQLKRWARLARNNDTLVDLNLPSFSFANTSRSLTTSLKQLGVRQAFDDPKGSANFDPIFERTTEDYLAVSGIYQSTFVALDEGGTEAAAVTAVGIELVSLGVERPSKRPVEMHVNRPFLFAIQHAPTGACLFLGRVVDPQQK